MDKILQVVPLTYYHGNCNILSFHMQTLKLRLPANGGRWMSYTSRERHLWFTSFTSKFDVTKDSYPEITHQSDGLKVVVKKTPVMPPRCER